MCVGSRVTQDRDRKKGIGIHVVEQLRVVIATFALLGFISCDRERLRIISVNVES